MSSPSSPPTIAALLVDPDTGAPMEPVDVSGFKQALALDLVDNTPDAGKPVSTAQAAAASAVLASAQAFAQPRAAAVANIAAASTTDLSAMSGDYANITGSGVQITGFGTSAATGTVRKIVFAGWNCLINSASLILPGAANLNTSPGDTATAVYETAGWRLLNFKRADGQEVAQVPFCALPKSGYLNVFGDSQTLGANNSGAAYTTTDAYGNRLKPEYRWTEALAGRDGRSLTLYNAGEGGSKISWDPTADLSGPTYKWRSHFNRFGVTADSWTGVAAFMPGWNDRPGTSTDAQFAANMRSAYAALAARALIDGYGGISTAGNLSTSTSTYMPSWSTTGTEADYTATSPDERPYTRPFSIQNAGGGYSLSRQTIQLQTTQYVQFTLTGKRGCGIFYETTPDGGPFSVLVNGNVVWTGTSLYNDGTNFRFPRVAWIENLPPTAVIQVLGGMSAGQQVIFLAAGWTDWAPANLPRLVIFGGTSGNLVAGSLTDVEMFNQEMAARDVCGAFGDYNIWHADVYSSWVQATDQDPGDTAHFTPTGAWHVYQAFRKPFKIGRAYIPDRVDLIDPSKFRQSPGAAIVTSAANTNAILQSSGSGESRLQSGTSARVTFNGGTLYGVKSDGSPAECGASNLPWNSFYLRRTVTAAGTTGAQSIGTISGTVNFAAGASSLVVTCTNTGVVSASSFVLVVIRTNDATLKSVVAVPGTNTFTIYGNAAATAETSVGFVIFP
jgi:hypothetical protein